MSKTWILGLGMTLSAMLAAVPAFAQDEEIDRECITECREAQRDCRFDANELGKSCLEEAGCDVLRDSYREACFAEDRDEEACSEARTAYRECAAPCREARNDAATACREELAICLEDECGIEKPFRPRRGRRGGGRGRR